ARLFPDRRREELAAGLALTPVLLSHDASRSSADALGEALLGMGAAVKVAEVEEDEPTMGAVEIGADFFLEKRKRREQQTRTIRSMRAPKPDGPRAPWEED
ncbi:MAG: hypothetical protein QGH45_05990, partial [Myxococcota bacterium]|nr:hypothetical protein [Myxococcota bacterium]